MIKQTDLAWLAGIIDGEGSIGLTFSKTYKPQLQLENTNLAMMEKVCSVLAAMSIGTRTVTNVKNQTRNPKWKLSYRICVAKQSDLLVLLTALEPYLVAKKPQALRLLEWLHYRSTVPRRGSLRVYSDYDLGIYKKLKELNA